MFKVFFVSLLFGGAVGVCAQTAIPAPLPPEQIGFRHWPKQFVQWVGPELPYTMIELYVDPGAGPLYEAVLTERTTGKRVHYTNQQAMLEVDKRSGGEAYLTRMELDRPANVGTGGTYLLRFNDRAEQPVSWQFVQGSDMSERGGGISPAGTETPVLVYRTQSAVAGEGTALKIGNSVGAAEVWTEISQPPYFIAYHGAVSENVDIAVFAGAGQRWSVVSAPQALTVGAEWKLKASDGVGGTLRVQALAGSHATVVGSDEHFPGRTVTVEGDYVNGVWSFSKMRYAGVGEDANQGLTILFSPAVSGGGQVKFEVIAGRKTRIANGSLQEDAEKARVGWSFKDPEWLRGKTGWVGSVVVR